MFRTTLLALVLIAPTRAEERTFAVSLDGKPAGECKLTIETRDGTTTVTYAGDRSAASPSDARGREVWKHDRLVQLEASATASGHTTTVEITASSDGFVLKSGAKHVTVRVPDVWPTPGWILPESVRRGATVVNTESGEVIRAKVERMGADRVTVSGKVMPATRYRVTAGGTTVDLWYDDSNRLLRRAWNNDGRTAIMELTSVKRD